jgi:hypothetical protein
MKEASTKYSFQINLENNLAIAHNQEYQIQSIKQINGTKFSLLEYYPKIYFDVAGSFIEDGQNCKFIESINDTIKKSLNSFDIAIDFFKRRTPDFYNAIELSNKEFAIFNTYDLESFAALHYFGTTFLNLCGQKHDEVFFIDDIAHQSGHVMFYALTHNVDRFLKVNRNTIIKEFTNDSHDNRDVYSAFHGLFTLTSILHCLDTALEQSEKFNEEQRHHIISRIGFYYKRLETDLSLQGDDRLLTKDGWNYYEMFYTGFLTIKKKYYHIIKYFDYSNQTYDFNFQLFKNINQI